MLYHPNPLQNPLGVCVPVYKYSKCPNTALQCRWSLHRERKVKILTWALFYIFRNLGCSQGI